jgi:hypothetical protein
MSEGTGGERWVSMAPGKSGLYSVDTKKEIGQCCVLHKMMQLKNHEAKHLFYLLEKSLLK